MASAVTLLTLSRRFSGPMLLSYGNVEERVLSLCRIRERQRSKRYGCAYSHHTFVSLFVMSVKYLSCTSCTYPSFMYVPCPSYTLFRVLTIIKNDIIIKNDTYNFGQCPGMGNAEESVRSLCRIRESRSILSDDAHELFRLKCDDCGEYPCHNATRPGCGFVT